MVDGVIGREGCWFWDNLGMEIGDGKEAFFLGRMSGTHALKERFPRLYLLSTYKDGKVTDMGSWD